MKEMDFADIEGQGHMLPCRRSKQTDALHESFGIRTDYQFIACQKMRGIQKKKQMREINCYASFRKLKSL